MKMLARHYTKILLINIEEATTEPELLQMATLINTVATRIGYVIIDANLGQLGLSARDILEKLKVHYEKSRIKLYLVADKVPEADHATLVEALDAINTNESAKITEIFSGEYKFKELVAQNIGARAELAKSLGLPDTAPMELIKKSFSELEKKNNHLRQVHNALSKDVKTMGGHDTNPKNTLPPLTKPIAESKKRVLDIIESSGVLK